MTSSEVEFINQKKLKYTMKVVEQMEDTFRQIHQQRKRGQLSKPMQELYKLNIVDHIDDYRFFNRANVDGYDLKEVLNSVDSFKTSESYNSESESKRSEI